MCKISGGNSGRSQNRIDLSFLLFCMAILRVSCVISTSGVTPTYLSNLAVLLQDIITHRLPMEDVEKGLKLVNSGRESIKVILTPPEHTQEIVHT